MPKICSRSNLNILGLGEKPRTKVCRADLPSPFSCSLFSLSAFGRQVGHSGPLGASLSSALLQLPFLLSLLLRAPPGCHRIQSDRRCWLAMGIQSDLLLSTVPLLSTAFDSLHCLSITLDLCPREIYPAKISWNLENRNSTRNPQVR